MSDFSREADRHFLDTTGSSAASTGTGDGTDDAGDESSAWTAERARLLGALIEKALATPQNYPLSLNALTMACNQTTNRDPIMDLAEPQIEHLLDEAKTDGWVRFVHPRSGRGVTKYRHVVDEVLDLDDRQVAVLGVLALRGPQTGSEIRTRTERLAPMAADEVEAVLSALADRSSGPLVRRLDREPGHRERRWIQLLCPAQGEDRAGQPPAASPRRAAAASAPGAAPGAGAGLGNTVDEAEVAALRQEVAELRRELADVRTAFEAFRAEFG
ncbi:MAG: DUF480 domain-containing protein [Actinomycetota bacterium]